MSEKLKTVRLEGLMTEYAAVQAVKPTEAHLLFGLYKYILI